MKLIALILLALLAIVCAILYGFSPNGPFYTYGNIRWSPFLKAFGFCQPLPEGFLQPADLFLRLFHNNTFQLSNKTESELKQLVDQKGQVIYLEYMPDRSYVILMRCGWQKEEDSTQELAKTFLLNCGHLLPGLPLKYTSAIGQTKSYKTVFAGNEYDCLEAPMAIDGNIAVRKIKYNEKYQGLIAIRLLASTRQAFVVQVITPGVKVNLEPVNKLLNCIDLDK